MTSSTVRRELEDLIYQGGMMGDLVRQFDWSKTAVGEIANWPPSMRAAVNVCLNSRFPMVLWLGDDLNTLYNDSWAPILGAKHPEKLGAPARETWSEIWHIIGPQLQSVIETGQATWSEDMLLPLARFGFTEECYFTYSYSPIVSDGGKVVGAFTSVTETSLQVRGERRLATLRDLGASSEGVKSMEQACRKAMNVIDSNKFDFPFSVFYQLGPEKQLTVLEKGTEHSLNIDENWPIEDVIRTQKPVHCTHVKETFVHFPDDNWGGLLKESYLLPVMGTDALVGVLVCGISPWITFNEKYRSFLELVANQIENSVKNAQSYEAELKRAEKLAEIDKAKTVFFNNVSHEFRTPLTLMLGPLEDVLAGHISESSRQPLELVLKNSKRLLKLVNALLDFSRIESARMQASYEATDLSEFTRDLASSFRSLTEKAKMMLIIDCPTSLESVFIDKEMWEKIVLNLLSNAFKFTLNGSITVRLEYLANDVKFSVEDTGIGIPEKELPHVFDRFHRIPNVQARTQEGTGIGLALVKELVHYHSGEITVQSVHGKGSCFTVTIPRGSDHLPKEKINAAKTLARTQMKTDQFIEEALGWLPQYTESLTPDHTRDRDHEGLDQHAKILLADDNADMRKYLSQLLSPYWTVEAATNGQEAFNIAVQSPPDLILSDVMMPVMNGIELLKHLRDNDKTRHIPVILLSARAGEEARVSGLQTGADDYLIKPFSAKELVARVKTHLQLSLQRIESTRMIQEAKEQLEISNTELEKRVQQRTQELEIEKLNLQEANTKLNRMNVRLEKFSHIAAHDLREPATRILTLTSLLTDDLTKPVSEEATFALQALKNQANKMLGLISDFRYLTKLSYSNRPDLVDIDCASLIHDVLESLSEDFHGRDITLSSFPTVRFKGYYNYVYSLYKNLVSNALKHAEGPFHLSFTHEDRVFGVKNTGSTIPEELRERIFEPFERGGGSGSGLGLYICKVLMSTQNGKIWVESGEDWVHFKFTFGVIV